VINKNTFETEYNIEEYGINLIKEQDKIIVDTLKWNGKAKKSGFEMGDLIIEFKIQNSNRPNKTIIYPIAILLLFIFGYLNSKRKQ
jgi:C-terminal processing protease CtpA/Prc